MGIALLDTEKLPSIIKNKLMNGWIIIEAINNCMGILEDNVYTPGTPKNANLEVIFIPGMPLRILWLGKKTEDLRKFLQSRITEVEWKDLFRLALIEANNGMMAVLIDSYKPNRKEEAIDNFIKKLLQNIKD